MNPFRLAWAIPDPELAVAIQSCVRELPVHVTFKHDGFDSFFRQLRAASADIVLLQNPDDNLLRAQIGRVKGLPAPPTVMVVSTSVEAASILAAFRAGADEYLHPPFDENLLGAISRESERRRSSRVQSAQRGQILGFLSVKGGCGGTTIACGAAIELARREQPGVLLLDLDLSAGITRFLTAASGLHSTADVIGNSHRLDQDCWNGFVSTGPCGLHVLPARSGFGGAYNPPVEAVREVLRFVRANYTWTIADLGSGLSLERLPVCEEVDVLYIVTTVDVPALYRSVQLIRQLQDSSIPKTGLRLLVRQADSSPAAMTADEVEAAVGTSIHTFIPEDRPALERWHTGKYASARGKLTRSFEQLASAIAGKPAAVPGSSGESFWRTALRTLQPSRDNA